MMAWGPIEVEGRGGAPGERFVNADQRVAAADYFRVMEIPLRKGRLFNDEDTVAAPRVAIVDERMAQQLWPGADPIGRHLRNGGIDASSTAPWITVVGVVGNIKQDSLDLDSRMALYLAQTQITPRNINVLVRSHGDPSR
jgi:hypothetical protein